MGIDRLSMNWDAMVRRSDQMLRAVFTDLTTEIYKVKNKGWQIYIDLSEPDFGHVKQQFDRHYKAITLPCELVNVKPLEIERQIPSIPDNLIPCDFEGIEFTDDGLLYLLRVKFPKVNFYKISANKVTAFVHVYHAKQVTGMGFGITFLSVNEKEKIQHFLDGFKLPYSFELVEDQVDAVPEQHVPFFRHPVLELSNERHPGRPSAQFIDRDESLWFDNINGVFEGKFKKDDLFFYDPSAYSCYADFSIFKNINIRNFLFLYQTVYLALPFDEDLQGWLNEQKVEQEEFMTLIQRGRIRIVLNQPEWRYLDQGFFNEIFKINPTGIISRRALALLQQIDFVDMADNYVFNDPALLKELKPFCEIVAKYFKVDARLYFDLISWPLKAKRASFQGLNDKGIMSVGGYGVNTVLDKLIGNQVKSNLEFDFAVNASNIHFAHALNATYFPYFDPAGYSDLFYANVSGDFLNMYRQSTAENITRLSNVINKRNTRVPALSPIRVIELNDFIPILELDDLLTSEYAFPKGAYLMNYLSSLDIQQMKTTINWYNKKVKAQINRNAINKQVIDVATDVGLEALGIVSNLSFLGLGLNMIKNGTKLTKRFQDFEHIKAKIDQAYTDDVHKENIHFLSQINRVAKIKRF